MYMKKQHKSHFKILQENYKTKSKNKYLQDECKLNMLIKKNLDEMTQNLFKNNGQL